MQHRQTFLGCVALAAASLSVTALALHSASSLSRGWAPLIAMHGKGDTERAVVSLRAANRAMDTILARTELDPATEKFVEQAWEELSDFHLDDFYELLPHKSGDWREIGVIGAVQGSAFRIRQADLKTPFQVTAQGSRKNLGDFSVHLRAKPTRTLREHRAFLLQGRAGLGIGAISWSSVTQAATSALRLVATGDPMPGTASAAQPSEGALARMRVLHPKLGAEDLEVLALLHDAYPATSEAIGEIARIDDLRVRNRGSAYNRLRVSARILPERMKRHYPELGKHFAKLDRLLRLRMRLLDTRGRSVLEGEVDTDAMRVMLELCVKDGMLLPFSRDGVAVDEPIDLTGPALARSRLVIDARIEVLGLVIHLDRLRSELAYTNHGERAHFGSAVKTLPGIRVEGAGLGFVPPGLIDALIPGNIAGLTRDFLEVAARGNSGRGLTVDVTAGSMAIDQPGVVEVELGVEALDNFMVKLGVGIVNERVVPDDDESAEMDKLNLRMQRAFSRDFERFAARAKNPG